MNNYREASRTNWKPDGGVFGIDCVNAGSLQRIADATEAMAQNHALLVQERDYFKARCNESYQKRSQLERRIRALKGVITKLKAKGGDG